MTKLYKSRFKMLISMLDGYKFWTWNPSKIYKNNYTDI